MLQTAVELQLRRLEQSSHFFKRLLNSKVAVMFRLKSSSLSLIKKGKIFCYLSNAIFHLLSHLFVKLFEFPILWIEKEIMTLFFLTGCWKLSNIHLLFLLTFRDPCDKCIKQCCTGRRLSLTYCQKYKETNWKQHFYIRPVNWASRIIHLRSPRKRYVYYTFFKNTLF